MKQLPELFVFTHPHARPNNSEGKALNKLALVHSLFSCCYLKDKSTQICIMMKAITDTWCVTDTNLIRKNEPKVKKKNHIKSPKMEQLL